MKRRIYILMLLLLATQFGLSQNGLSINMPDSITKITNTVVNPVQKDIDSKKEKISTPQSENIFTLPSDTQQITPKHSDIPLMMNDTVGNSNDTVFNEVQPLYLNFKPNPHTALWLAFTFPGLGQIYNRKYWKLPIIYGIGIGIGYAISHTNNLYKDYLVGYQSFSSSSPNPNLYMPLIPKNYPEANIGTYLKNQMNDYRRYRDISIVAAVALYALSIVDAFVDAQLSDFDISPDLSMKVKPTVEKVNEESSVGVGMQVNF